MMRHLIVVLSLATGLDSKVSAHDEDGNNGSQTIGGAGGPLGWFDEHNMAWLGQVTLTGLHPGATRGNDCWGYVSPSGREYGIIGISNGFGFVEVTDPLQPHLVHFEVGAESIWRDVKVFSHYAYGVSEANIGIQVYDLSQIDSGLVTLVNTIMGPGNGRFHNVAINEDSGYLYRCGGGGADSGLRIYDLNADPMSPTFEVQWLGDIRDIYVHDCMAVTYASGPHAGREIVFAFGGPDTGRTDTSLHIVDVTDKDAIFSLAEIPYPDNAYSHQGWLSSDRQYLYLDDELDEIDFGHTTRTLVFDVANLNNASYVGSFTNGNTASDHNLYVKDHYIYEANSRSGLRVYDNSGDPRSPIEVAYLDTYRLDDDPGSAGAWSVFPYLPSGTILISDRQQGLITARLLVNRVDISFPVGVPEMMHPTGGTVITAQITNVGMTADLSALRLRFESGAGTGQIAPVPGAQTGWFDFTLPPGACNDTLRIWIEAPSIEGPVFHGPARAPVDAFELTVATEAAKALDYDFENTVGWSITTTALQGEWEQGVPINSAMGDPPHDLDTSGQCFLTWNLDEVSGVVGGDTILTSPTIDALFGGTIEYGWWLSSTDGTLSAEDGLFVELSVDDGASWQRVRSFNTARDVWMRDTIDVESEIGTTPTLRVRFIASEGGVTNSLEAAIDAFSYRGFNCEFCGADWNDSGVVNSNDFLAYLNDYNAVRTGGNFVFRDPDLALPVGVINTADFLSFLIDYNTICP